jgi:hypothetical protein
VCHSRVGRAVAGEDVKGNEGVVARGERFPARLTDSWRRVYKVESILAAIKRPVSVHARRFLVESGEQAWLDRLTVRKGKQRVFRLWQGGGGHDENLWNERPVESVIAYIKDNPRRRGLVLRATDWYWSSARWHAGERDGPLAVDAVRL